MNDARAYLRQLAEEFAGRDWPAELRGGPNRPVLWVSNPDAPQMGETITCRATDGEMAYCWPSSQAIGPVSECSQVADRIQHVLRGVEP